MSFPFTHAEAFGEAPEAQAGFYREVLGWTVTQAEGVDYWRLSATGAAPSAGSGSFAGGIARRPDFMPKGWLPYAHVPDIAACVATTERLGGKVVRDTAAVPRTGWYAVLEDCAGNPFAVFQPDPKAFPMPEPD